MTSSICHINRKQCALARTATSGSIQTEPNRTTPFTWFYDIKITLQIPILLVLCMLIGSGTRAATLEGQQFSDVVRLGNRELRLNGLGVRKILFIKVYVAGLYLNDAAATPSEVSNMPGPKRLQLRMLRSAGAEDFSDALVNGMRNSVNVTEGIRLAERINQLDLTIRTVGAAAKGDIIALDYIPEIGTRLTVNGANHGKVISGADFYEAVLALFIGNKPVDTQLKRGLLGQ